MDVQPGQIRRSPDGARWRVLGFDTTGYRNVPARSEVVGLEKLERPGIGCGWFKPLSVVAAWPVVTGAEDAA